MGNGIAHVFAQNDYPLTLVDINPDLLEKGIETISKNMDRQIKKNSSRKKRERKTDKRRKKNKI